MQISNCQLCRKQIEVEYGSGLPWVCNRCIKILARQLTLDEARALYVEKLKAEDKKSCTCMTKTPEVKYHDENCQYRKWMEERNGSS